MSERLRFPEGFRVGSAVSPFQVEGNPTGERRTDWDLYRERNPDVVKTGENEPNWWPPKRAKKDIQTLAGLGLQSQRLGIEWDRIMPERGRVNKEALRQYRELFDDTGSLGMEVMGTLCHLTLPARLAAQGGWENKKTVEEFVDFADVVAQEFGDVPYWITIGEPNTVVRSGYILGDNPPHKTDPRAAILVRFRLKEAHEEARAVLKRHNPDARVGVSHILTTFLPKDPRSALDRSYTALFSYINDTNYIHATYKDSDFIGLDFYSGYYTRFNPRNLRLASEERIAYGVPEKVLLGDLLKPEAETSDSGWPIVPEFFLRALRYLNSTFGGMEIVIAENGLADAEDEKRSFYILTHLIALWKAIEEGVDVRRYMHWSSLDNFEWTEGYRLKFGLIGVDPKTGKRTVRKSAKLLGEIARTGEIDIDALADEYLTEKQRREMDQIVKRIGLESGSSA